MKLKIHLAELNRFEVIQGQNDLTYQQKPPIQTKEKDIAPWTEPQRLHHRTSESQNESARKKREKTLFDEIMAKTYQTAKKFFICKFKKFDVRE